MSTLTLQDANFEVVPSGTRSELDSLKRDLAKALATVGEMDRKYRSTDLAKENEKLAKALADADADFQARTEDYHRSLAAVAKQRDEARAEVERLKAKLAQKTDAHDRDGRSLMVVREELADLLEWPCEMCEVPLAKVDANKPGETGVVGWWVCGGCREEGMDATRAQEREACAKVLEDEADTFPSLPFGRGEMAIPKRLRRLAAAIRARSKDKLAAAIGHPPNRTDAPGGPVCGCGKPSRHESGWCGGQCVARPDRLDRLVEDERRASSSRCGCGHPGCTGPGDNEKHQCGGPKEACCVARCPECNPPPRPQVVKELLPPQVEVHGATPLGVALRRAEAAERELERWRHGTQVEGDYVCPDSLKLAEAQAQVTVMRRALEKLDARVQAMLGAGYERLPIVAEALSSEDPGRAPPSARGGS